MLSFKNYIEAFTDPESKKTFHWGEREEFLKKFENRKDIFVTFHDVPKFGLNPINKYNTPTGIYSYPIDYVLRNWNPNIQYFDLPFAGESKYFSVFQHSKNKLINIINDKIKLPNVDQIQENLDEFIFNFIKNDYKSNFQTYKNSYMKVQFNTDIKFMLSDFYSFKNTYLKKTTMPNYDELKEGLGKIIIEALDEYKFPNEDDIKSAWNNEEEFLNDKQNLLTGKAKIYTNEIAKLNYASSFPWVMLLIKAKNNNNFNKICRNLEIAGFNDHGTGTIHENEPTQAVFFNIDDLKLIPPSPIENFKIKANDKLNYKSNWITRFKNAIDRFNGFVNEITLNISKQKQNLLIKNSIRKNRLPDDQVLYNWLEFCAKNGLYKEGVIIYNKINKSNKTEDELYFINKYGELCKNRLLSPDTFGWDDFEKLINALAINVINIIQKKPQNIEIDEMNPLININTLQSLMKILIQYEDNYPIFKKVIEKLKELYQTINYIFDQKYQKYFYKEI